MSSVCVGHKVSMCFLWSLVRSSPDVFAVLSAIEPLVRGQELLLRQELAAFAENGAQSLASNCTKAKCSGSTVRCYGLNAKFE